MAAVETKRPDDKSARFFVAKCDHISRLRRASEDCIWACTERKSPPQPQDVLCEAFNTGDVVLIFSINNHHGWHGYATMASKPGEGDATETLGNASKVKDSEESVGGDRPGISSSPKELRSGSSKEENNNPSGKVQDTNWHRFRIKWNKLFLLEHGEQCVRFSDTETLRCLDGSSVNKARNLQEVAADSGQALCRLIDAYHVDLSEAKRRRTEADLERRGKPFFSPGKQTDPQEVWCGLVQKVQSMGKVILACAFGSQRYNLHNAQSDVDMFVVYSAETRDVLGFEPPLHTIKNRDTEACDYTIHEVFRFCELLLQGDPRCVETLFLHPSAVYMDSEEYQELCQHRCLFLTRACSDRYVRDATGTRGLKLLDKWVASGEALKDPMPVRVCKLLYIILRLLFNAREVAVTRQLEVYRVQDSEQWSLLTDTRQGRHPYAFLRGTIDRLLKEIEASKVKEPSDTSTVKSSPAPKAILEAWLMAIRYRSLQQYVHRTREKVT